jgi:hypothetical protein
MLARTSTRAQREDFTVKDQQISAPLGAGFPD